MKISGEVIKIRFFNEENGYGVFDLNAEGGELKVVGNFESLSVGELLEIEGNFSYDNKYGEQFSAISYEKKLPKSENEIVKYLSSGIISGIGSKNARLIVESFGKNSLDIVFDETDRLKEIRGIGKKSIEKIKSSVNVLRISKDILFKLSNLGISLTLSRKIYSVYKEDTLNVINENPYKLIKNVKGIGFLKADEIALKNNMDRNSPFRIESAIIYLLNQKAINNGHVFYPKDKLTKEVSDLIGVEEDLIVSVYVKLVVDCEITIDTVDGEEVIYLDYLYNSENYISSKISKMIFNDEFKIHFDVEKEVNHFLNDLSINLSENQIKAIKSAFDDNVFIITGGPGTGKTTIINTIANIYQNMGYNIMLCAPTGRATKRIEESSGIEAKTIHRMLGYMPLGDGFGKFEYNEDNTLDADLIIVDETSMVDLMLFENLLRGLKDSTKLILVGDIDQLPSVGAGNILRDLINSNVIKVVILNEIFRQSKDSNIILNAHKINSGESPILNGKGSDFFFLPTNNNVETRNLVVDLVSRRLPKAYGYNSLKDIQILTQTKKGICGVVELNKVLQEILNPLDAYKKEITFGHKIFRLGDKVMQTKNNYNLGYDQDDEDFIDEENVGVFNGDMGYISFIDNEDKKVFVDLEDGRNVKYSIEDLDNLELGYSITIHKSQGSEFKCIIIPLFDGFYMLQTRNLLYTAITRAKELIVLVGDINVMNKMISNNTINSRYSNLTYKIRYYYDVIGDMLNA